jgi:adenylate cyclase
VLPFTNLSNDPEQGYFADAITDDVTTDLSRISGSFVIARSTAFTYKGKPVDVKQIGRELGVRYVLEGSVQRAGDDIRVNVQLVDTEAGGHLWADRFDTDRRNLMEITGRLARSLNLELLKDWGRRIEQERAVDPDVRDLVMRGYAVWYRPRSIRNNEEAERIFTQALAIDPRSIDAKIGIAKILVSNVTQAWSRSADEDTGRAERLLLDVLEQDTGSALAHSTMGMVRRFENRLTESRFEFETAIELDPNDTYAHIQLGWVLLYLGDPAAAVARCERAIRLSPRDPQLWGYHLPLGWCRLLCNDVDPAVDQLLRSRALNPRLWHIHIGLAAALGLSGNSEDAKTVLAEMLKLKPEASSLAQYRVLRPWGNSRYWALFEKTAAAGLRRAEFPDA